VLRRRYPYLSVAIVLPVYLAAGTLGGTDQAGDGWSALLAVPRLYAAILFCGLTYVLLIRQRRRDGVSFGRDGAAWAVALAAVVALGVWTNLRHQRGIYEDYRWRVAAPKDVYLAADPAVEGNSILFVAMRGDGYHSAAATGDSVQYSASSQDDLLAVSAGGGEGWVERVGHESTIVPDTDLHPAGGSVVQQAESPVASSDGKWLAFLREDHGRGRIWVRALGQAGERDHPDHPGNADRPATPAELNVTEMSFLPTGLPTGELIFAAASGGRMGLFVAGGAEGIRSLDTDGMEARYPAVSPDGRWLAYSRLQGGNWNLWLRDLKSGQSQRLTDAACNMMEPTWEADSKTLVYSSDCGRAQWFSVICRRRVVP
jgi:hypothetical protein